MPQNLPCPTCGYLMSPFQQDCPRCKALAAAPPPAAPPVQSPSQWVAPPPVYVTPTTDIIQIPPGAHSTATAVILGFLLVGLGQVINRQIGKGVVLFFLALGVGLFTMGIGIVVVWLIAFVDAACVGQRLNRGEPVRTWQWF